MHRDDQRFAERLLAHQRVDCTGWQRRHAAIAEKRRPLREFDTAGEVLAVSEQDGATQLRVCLVHAVGLAQLGVHLQIEGVALGGSVQPDQQKVPACLEGDALGCHVDRQSDVPRHAGLPTMMG